MRFHDVEPPFFIMFSKKMQIVSYILSINKKSAYSIYDKNSMFFLITGIDGKSDRGSA